MASAMNENASAKLLLPAPFRPTRKVGLSSTSCSDAKLRKALKAMLCSLFGEDVDMGHTPYGSPPRRVTVGWRMWAILGREDVTCTDGRLA